MTRMGTAMALESPFSHREPAHLWVRDPAAYLAASDPVPLPWWEAAVDAALMFAYAPLALTISRDAALMEVMQ